MFSRAVLGRRDAGRCALCSSFRVESAQATPPAMDLLVQCTHQSHCRKLVLYHGDPDLDVFPERFASRAEEVGPRSDKDGPMLTRFFDVGMQPAAFLAWFEQSLLPVVCTRFYWVDPVIYANDQEALVSLLCAMEVPSGAVRLHCHPRSLDVFLQERLSVSWDLSPQHFEHVLSVVAAGGRYYHMLQPAAWLYRQGSEPPAESRRSASKAVGKLREAMRVMAIDAGSICYAIDLGAAPGSWTEHLAGFADCVVAVDPAELSIPALPNVSHLRCKAEDATAQIRNVLTEGADLLATDMNKHPAAVINLILELLPVVRKGGWMIVTMKFYGVGRDRSKWSAKLSAELLQHASVCKIVWLLTNSVNERTLIAQKR